MAGPLIPASHVLDKTNGMRVEKGMNMEDLKLVKTKNEEVSPELKMNEQRRKAEMAVISRMLRSKDDLEMIMKRFSSSDFYYASPTEDYSTTKVVFNFIVGFYQEHGTIIQREEMIRELQKRGESIAEGSPGARIVVRYMQCLTTASSKTTAIIIDDLVQHAAIGTISSMLKVITTASMMQISHEAKLSFVQKNLMGYLEAASMFGTGYNLTSPSMMRSMLGSQEWLWEGWIPLGHLSMIFGTPGIGKTFLAQEIALVVSGAVDRFPDGQAAPPKSKVLWIDYEGQASTVAERLGQTKLDDSGIILIDEVSEGAFSLPSLCDRKAKKSVYQIIESIVMGNEVKLVIIDSLTGGTGGVDENSRVMADPLAELARQAAKLGIAIVILHHPRKSGEDETDLHRVNQNSIRGSSSISGIPRSIIALDRPKEGPCRCRVIKHSLVPSPPHALGYIIEDARVIGTDDMFDMDEALLHKKRSKTDECEDWLRKLFIIDPVIAAVEIYSSAEKQGYTQKICQDASERIGISKTKKAEGWMWEIDD